MLYIVLGLSGVGKTTIGEEFWGADKRVQTMTTRKRRANEPSTAYYFVTEEEFESNMKQNQLMLATEYHGNKYGTPISEIEAKINSDKEYFIVLDMNGMLELKARYPEIISILIYSNTTKLDSRGLGSEEIKSRQKFDSEIRYDNIDLNVENVFGNKGKTFANLKKVLNSFR